MIYQVFVGRWASANLKEHQGEVFANLSKINWSYLKKNGFEYIYLLGIFDNLGPVIVDHEEGVDLKDKNRLPSVFAIRDHASANPCLGSSKQLRDLIKSIKKHNLKVICDFVPNHRSVNHPWIDRYPEYFVKDESGKFIYEFSGDVIKLNYDNKKLREQMELTLEAIGLFGFDGVRCDMAHFIPLDFWSNSTKKLKSKFSDFKFFGEVYPNSPFDLSLYQIFFDNGFDGLYESVLFKNLNQLISGVIETRFVCDHINYLKTTPYSTHLIHYFFNHDDFISNGNLYIEALLGVCLSMRGNFLTFNGSLNRLTNRLAHHSLDILPNNINETNQIQEPVRKILKYFNDNQLEFDQSKPSQKQVIEIDLKISQNDSKRIKLICNFSRENILLNEFEIPNETGLVHQYQKSNRLNSGQLEIFSYEN